MSLGQSVRISPQFQRSVRIDLDFGKAEALEGYVLQASTQTAIQAIAKHIGDAATTAFTFTGPYGGGKSSLALLLTSRLAGTPGIRRLAKNKLGAKTDGELGRALGVDGKRWQYLPIVGSRRDLVSAMWDELKNAGLHKRRAGRPGKADLANTLLDVAKRPSHCGLVVVVDELGKHLEHASRDGSDIFVLQQIAEAANRSNRRLIFIGILHQAFDQYANRLGRQAKEEWAKIQGRFTDIPIVVPVDEVIDLIGRAIVSSGAGHGYTESMARTVAEEIRKNRPGYSEDLWKRLDRCWPLHPAAAALIGPISRRRFSQNERSIFSFLGSAEPLGFRDFIQAAHRRDGKTFTPAAYWDYLKANLEASILASRDGHRWAQAAEAVNRAEAKGTELHIAVTKSIALIDLFKNGSGLSATDQVVGCCVQFSSRAHFVDVLRDLTQWSVIAFRKHQGAWVIHEGSDFDIDSAVSVALAAGIEFSLDRLATLTSLQPVLAKRLYHETGTLRWFLAEVARLDEAGESARRFSGNDGAAGKFLLTIPADGESMRVAKQRALDASRSATEYPVAVAVAENAAQIKDLGYELLALESIERNRHAEIESDAVARREIAARVSTISALLEEELRAAFVSCEWFVYGKLYRVAASLGLSQLASQLAAECFTMAPIVKSELVNRHKPSSNSHAAIRQLLWAMVTNPTAPNLGLNGFSAERGLYVTVLQTPGVHREGKGGIANFVHPKESATDPDKFGPLWNAADELLKGREAPVTFGEMFTLWEKPPFGVRRGLMPILGLAYALSNPKCVSLYRDGMYQSEIKSIFADALLQDEGSVALRWFDIAKQERGALPSIACAIRNATNNEVDEEPLALSKALVKFAFTLPQWTQRTAHLSEKTASVLRMLLSASDPNRLLFIDLPFVLVSSGAGGLSKGLEECLLELRRAYSKMLFQIHKKLLDALKGIGASGAEIRTRAETVHGLTGDLLLDAFALRLSALANDPSELEGLISLVTSKPSREWTDRDIDLANIELARLAMRFRQAELLASVKGRVGSREAVAVAVSLPGEKATLRAVDVGSQDKENVKEMAADLRKFLLKRSPDRDLCLAAMAEAAFALAGGETSDSK